MKDVLAAAPVGVVGIDGQGAIDWVNDAAFELIGCIMGRQIVEYIHPDATSRFEQLSEIPGDTAELHLKGHNGTKVASVVSVLTEERRQFFFFTDVSEKNALSRQLRATQEPSKKLLHQLHTANTTMIGYAELISVMLDEEESLDGERLTVVRRYHKEITRCQQTIDRLLKVARHGGRRPDAGATVPINRRHVVVIDDESEVAEYVTELMKGLQHRVTTFTDGDEAASFLKKNAESIDLVITDYNMPSVTGLDLAAQVHAVRESLPILICPEQELSLSDEEQLFQCQKPLDINELIQIVTELV